jgi:hypothetical protein
MFVIVAGVSFPFLLYTPDHRKTKPMTMHHAA